MANELTLTRGDTRTFRITVKDNGSAFDLSGYSCYFTVKADKNDADADAIIGPITGSIVVAANGTVDFELDETDTAVEVGKYYYDVTVDDGANIFTVLESNITVVLDVTRTEATGDSLTLYATEDELRRYLQFDINDYPSMEDMRYFIKIAMINVDLDLDTSNTNLLFIATLLQGRYLVMKALASRSISKGYVQVNAEGRTITKAYQEFVLDAENSLQEYKEFLLRNGRREATSTNFLDDTSLIDDYTREDIINIMTGVTDGEDFQHRYGYRRL